MIHHHPPYDLLFDFASGSLPQPVALSVACHVEACPKCRSVVRELEHVGGAMLDAIEPESVSLRELDAVMARIDDLEDEEVAAAEVDINGVSLPQALSRFIANTMRDLSWKKSHFFHEARLLVEEEGYKVSLLRLKPGATMPRHTHRGVEYTLVLDGGFTDNGRSFNPGDFSAKDASEEHSPVVDDDGECLCLVVLDAPVKLTGPMGRLVNPFLRA